MLDQLVVLRAPSTGKALETQLSICLRKRLLSGPISDQNSQNQIRPQLGNPSACFSRYFARKPHARGTTVTYKYVPVLSSGGPVPAVETAAAFQRLPAGRVPL